MVVTVISVTLVFYCCEKLDTLFFSIPVPTFSVFLKDIESPNEVSTALSHKNPMKFELTLLLLFAAYCEKL